MAVQVAEAGRHFEQFVTQMNRRKSSQKTKTVAADEVGEGEQDTIGWKEGRQSGGAMTKQDQLW